MIQFRTSNAFVKRVLKIFDNIEEFNRDQWQDHLFDPLPEHSVCRSEAFLSLRFYPRTLNTTGLHSWCMLLNRHRRINSETFRRARISENCLKNLIDRGVRTSSPILTKSRSSDSSWEELFE